MRRFYSHYTFIFPDTYLKNVVVELDSENRIRNVFPFEKEIEKTEFYSGCLFFVCTENEFDGDIEGCKLTTVDQLSIRSLSRNIYIVYNEVGEKIA